MAHGEATPILLWLNRADLANLTKPTRAVHSGDSLGSGRKGSYLVRILSSDVMGLTASNTLVGDAKGLKAVDAAHVETGFPSLG